MLHVLEISCCLFSRKRRNNNSTYQYDKLQCGKIIYWNINVYVFFCTVLFLSKRSMDTFGILACESGCVWQCSGIMLTEGKKENRNIIVGYFRDPVGNDVFKSCKQRGLYARSRTLMRKHNLGSVRKFVIRPGCGIIIFCLGSSWKQHSFLNKEYLFDYAVLDEEGISSSSGELGAYTELQEGRNISKSYWA